MDNITNLIKKFIIENEIIEIKKTSFTLKSGRSSYFYVNWRHAMNSVEKIRKIVMLMYDKFWLSSNIFTHEEIDTIYGVPEAGTKLALAMSFELVRLHRSDDMNLSMGRGKPKEGHGDPADMHFLGEPRGNVIVIEDVVTTGTSMMNEVKKISGLPDIKSINCIVLTDRGNIKYNRDHVHTLIDIQEILPDIVELQKPSGHIVAAVDAELKELGYAGLS